MQVDKNSIKKGDDVEYFIKKIKHYCSYQERSHYEVREKLYGYKLYSVDIERIIAMLIEEGYLDEERYACSFARGKFNLKKWGRVKIKYALKQKKVSDYNIKAALKQIDGSDYLAELQKLAEIKWLAVKYDDNFTRQAKTTAYLLQKGFEAPLVQQAVKMLRDQASL